MVKKKRRSINKKYLNPQRHWKKIEKFKLVGRKNFLANIYEKQLKSKKLQVIKRHMAKKSFA